jgi:hypothetical protein
MASQREAIYKLKTKGFTSLQNNMARIFGLHDGSGFSKKRFYDTLAETDEVLKASPEIAEELSNVTKSAQDVYFDSVGIKAGDKATIGQTLYDANTTKNVRAHYIVKVNDIASGRGTKADKAAMDKALVKYKADNKIPDSTDVKVTDENFKKYYQEQLYKADIDKLTNNAMQLSKYTISEEGLANYQYRTYLDRYTKEVAKEGGNSEEAVRLAKLMNIARFTPQDTLLEYLNKDNSKKNLKGDALIKENEDRLVQLQSKHGMDVVKNELQRTAIADRMAYLRKGKYKDALTEIEKRYSAEYGLDKDVSWLDEKNVATFDAKKFATFAEKERKHAIEYAKGLQSAIDKAKTGEDKITYNKQTMTKDEAMKSVARKNEYVEALSAVINQINSGSQGMDVILSSLTDVLGKLEETVRKWLGLAEVTASSKNNNNPPLTSG